MGELFLFLVVALTVAAIVFGVTVLISGGDPGLTPVEPDGRAVPLPANRPLDEEDIARVRFDTSVRGYRMAQVDQALQRAAYDIGYKGELIGVLEAEVTALREGRTTDADVLRRAREAAVQPSADPIPAADPVAAAPAAIPADEPVPALVTTGPNTPAAAAAARAAGSTLAAAPSARASTPSATADPAPAASSAAVSSSVAPAALPGPSPAGSSSAGPSSGGSSSAGPSPAASARTGRPGRGALVGDAVPGGSVVGDFLPGGAAVPPAADPPSDAGSAPGSQRSAAAVTASGNARPADAPTGPDASAGDLGASPIFEAMRTPESTPTVPDGGEPTAVIDTTAGSDAGSSEAVPSDTTASDSGTTGTDPGAAGEATAERR